MTGYKFVKVRSKCQIKGCRSTGLKVPTFSVAASREGGASVVVCEKCIEGMFEKLCLMKGMPTYAELVEMQNAECKGQNDENNAKTPETVGGEGVNEEPAGEQETVDGEGVNEEPAGVPDEEAAVMVTEEPAGEQEAVDAEKPKKAAGKKKSKDSE